MTSHLPADLIHDILVHVTQGEARATIEQTPALAWMLDELDVRRDAIGSRLGGRAALDKAALIAEAKAADGAFDDARRHLHLLLSAGLYDGDAASRALVQTLLDVLFPIGLKVVNLSQRQAAASGPAFRARLERDDVQAGLEVVKSYVKGLKERVERCVRTADVLAEVMTRVDAHEVDSATPSSEQGALFQARREAISTWSTFVTVVEHAFPGDAPEAERARRRLLHRWQTLRAELAGQPQADAPTPVPADPLDAADTPTGE